MVGAYGCVLAMRLVNWQEGKGVVPWILFRLPLRGGIGLWQLVVERCVSLPAVECC